MEGSNKNNGLLIGIIMILLLIVGGLISYILFGTSKNSEKETNQVNNTIVEEKKEERVKGECPLTKFDTNYVLTDTDKTEIIESIESLKIGFTKDVIDRNSFEVAKIGDNGYVISVKFDCTPNTSGTFAYVVKVNDKLKVLLAGSGDTSDGFMRMNSTLERICS